MSRPSAPGFSLLEVLAAILLLAVAFGALMRVTGSSFNLSQRAAERSEAAMWARTVLDNAFIGQPLQPGSRSGRLDARYRWQLRVIPLASSTPGPQPSRLYRLELDILWGATAAPYRFHVSTLRLAAAPARNGA